MDLSPAIHDAAPTLPRAEAPSAFQIYDFLDSPDALQTWTPIQWAAYVDRKHEFDLLLKNSIPRQLLKLSP
jgi:hypothetical protein